MICTNWLTASVGESTLYFKGKAPPLVTLVATPLVFLLQTLLTNGGHSAEARRGLQTPHLACSSVGDPEVVAVRSSTARSRWQRGCAWANQRTRSHRCRPWRSASTSRSPAAPPPAAPPPAAPAPAAPAPAGRPPLPEERTGGRREGRVNPRSLTLSQISAF